jgi:hypothetical protein
MKAVNCGYYHHDFQKKGSLVEVDDGEKIQEMECSKCGISTYYPEEAFVNE